jgi:hypothetical protein
MLRKAPAPAAPFGLEQRLVQQAGLAAKKKEPAWSWFSAFQERSWAPAFASLCALAGLLTVVAFQQRALDELKEARNLAGAAPDGAQMPAPAAAAADAELEMLRKQAAELAALRLELAEIEGLLARQAQAAAENAALKAELSGLARNHPADSPEVQAALAEARQKAERIRCVNNLKNVGLAARIWATDNGGREFLPKDFLAMKNELNSPALLVCPSDPQRKNSSSFQDWDGQAAIGSSYEMLAPGVSERIRGAVYVRCPFHNNVLQAQGAVFQLRADQQLLQRDGHWEVGE